MNLFFKEVLISFCLILSLFFGINFISAQAVGSPEIYIKDLNFDSTELKAGDTVGGSFSMVNARDFIVSNIFYTISLMGDYENSIANSQLTSSKMIGPVLLRANEIKKIDFVYELPKTVSTENLGIQVRAMLANGSSLGWADKIIKISGALPSIKIIDASILINENNFSLHDGPMVYEGSVPLLKINLDNLSNNQLNLTPKVEIYNRSDAGKLLSSYNDREITTSPKAKSSIRLKLPIFDYTPGIYFGKLNLLDSTGQSQTNEVSFKYIISGDIVTINSLSATRSGSLINLKLNYSGSPYDILTGKISTSTIDKLNIKLVNENNTVAGEYSAEFNFNIGEEVEIPIKLVTDFTSLTAQINVINGNKIITTYQGLILEESKRVHLNNNSSLIYSGVILLALIIILSIIFLFKIKKKSILIILLLLILSSAFINRVQAYTVVSSFTGWSWTSAPTVTINSPLPANVKTYSPGEVFNFQGTASVADCSNSDNRARVFMSPIVKNTDSTPSWSNLVMIKESTIKSKTGGEVWGTRYTDFSSSNLTAPTAPGVYRIYFQVSDYFSNGGGWTNEQEVGYLKGYQEFVVADSLSCYRPEDKFKLTASNTSYSGFDAMCKSNYGNNWEFATINDSDESEILTGNSGSPLFNNFIIKNTPSNNSPFSGQVASVESGSWPETDKMVLTVTNPGTTYLYSDLPKTNTSYRGLCKNTTYNSLSVCPSSCSEYNPATETPKPLPDTLGLNVPNLIAYYPFNGNSFDIKNGYNATNIGTTFLTNGPFSGFDKAVYLSGYNYLSIPDSDAFDFSSGSFSNCLWYYKQDAGYPHVELISKRYAPGGYELQKNTEGNLMGGVYGYGSAYVTDPGNNKWTHVCYTQNNGTGILYVNGSEVNRANITGGLWTYNPNPLYIGRDNYCATNDWGSCIFSNYNKAYEYFKGYMDDVAFFNRAITPCEVMKLAKGPNACVNGELCISPLTATCTVSPDPAEANQVVTWLARPSGGSGTYTYSWSGEGVTGKTTQTATTTYSTVGLKYATSTISDGLSTTTTPCLGTIRTDCIGCNPFSGTTHSGVLIDSAECGISVNTCNPGIFSDLEDTVSTSTWKCSGFNPTTTTDDKTCSLPLTATVPDSSAYNCTSLTNSSGDQIRINTNTTWTALPNTGSFVWTISDSSGTSTLNESGNTMSKIFTTVGLKTVTVTIASSSNPTIQGTPCSTTTRVVQQGGSIGEI